MKMTYVYSALVWFIKKLWKNRGVVYFKEKLYQKFALFKKIVSLFYEIGRFCFQTKVAIFMSCLVDHELLSVCGYRRLIQGWSAWLFTTWSLKIFFQGWSIHSKSRYQSDWMKTLENAWKIMSSKHPKHNES